MPTVEMQAAEMQTVEMQTAELAPGHRISRVIKGGWQLAGGHGPVDEAAAIEDMVAFAEAGIVTFDCADIYAGVEARIGRFRDVYRQRRGEAALAAVRVHTKFVPDLEVLARISKADVARVIDTSLRRLKLEHLHLVQFHWWDHAVPGMIETAGWLGELCAAGKIANIGGTNFGTAALQRLQAAGVPLVSMQVQYSVLDGRPGRAMAETGVPLLAYGTVAGGLISERWLGAAEPAGALENRSLVKYRLIVDEVGGWTVFQGLLEALAGVAARRGSDIATVASAWVLGRPGVAAVIVGARNRAHLAGNLAIAALRLDAADLAAIDAALAELRPVPGDVYELERDRAGRHGAIMKYNLNEVAS